MNMNQKLKPAHHWERKIAQYDAKIAKAKNPTQRSYAMQMKRIAENSLKAARGGVLVVDPDPAVVDLHQGEYREA